ncbi:MAG TPA: MMPL family transporter, partial [Candidatus Acidoferrum sp.]|nr:MMPL family transporter [Candidatus Acidoferrum sp.]
MSGGANGMYPSPPVRRRAADLIGWILDRRRLVLAISLVVAVAGGLAASGLPLKSDFSALLPPSTESVRHLDAIQARVRAFATAFILVEAEDPVVRLAASDEVRRAVERIDSSLVTRVSGDDGPLRRFVWRNRHLFVKLEDLEQAQAALDERIKREKLRANPLYIDLDDEEEGESAGRAEARKNAQAGAAQATGDPRLDDLLKRLDEAEARAKSPQPFVSRNGHLQLIIVQASFPGSQISKSTVLQADLERIAAEVEGRHPDVRVGLTGDVATTLAEHDSILYGMLQAAAVTVFLVTLLLVMAYRSVPGILSVLWALAVGTLATLGLTRLLIGHLNVATAFLSAIVVGNGINPGLI